MEATLKYIEKKFREYNKKYFDNELPPLIFQLLKSYKLCGQFSYSKKTKPKGRLKSPKIEISCYYDWNEDDLRDVIVHEMIHYYLAYKRIDITLTHGTEFKNMAKKLNEKYNLNITEKIDCRNFKKAKNAPTLSWYFTKIFC